MDNLKKNVELNSLSLTSELLSDFIFMCKLLISFWGDGLGISLRHLFPHFWNKSLVCVCVATGMFYVGVEYGISLLNRV